MNIMATCTSVSQQETTIAQQISTPACPEWCVVSHDQANDSTLHNSEIVNVGDVALSLERFDDADGQPGALSVNVQSQDACLTATETRQLISALSLYVALIEG